jgi:tape measure domain-containing protein
MVVGDLVLQMAADIARFRTDMDEVKRSTSGVASAAQSAGSMLRTAFAGISVSYLVREFIALADGMQMIEAKLKLATTSQKSYTEALGDVFAISQRNMTSIDATTKLYSRLNPVLEKLGGNTATTAAVTEAISAALRVSGATAAEASSTMIQMSQALASGVLRGEEFNSVSENGSRLLVSLEKALGKTRGELREMAQQGKLTSDVVAKALIKDLEQLKKEAASMPLTVSAAFQMLQNELTVYAGQVNKSTGFTAALANGIEFLSKNLRLVGDTLLTGITIATAYFAIYKGGPVIIAAVTGAFNLLTAALARYVTAGVLGATAATGGLTGALIMTNSATLTLVGGVTMLQASFGVLIAAFAGWQIGKWARENFLEVELFGIAMVSGLLKSWEYLKFGFHAVIESVVWAWEKGVGFIQGIVAEFLTAFTKGLERLGLDEAAEKVRAWADSFATTSREVRTLEERMKPLRDARDTEIAQINTITDEMADYAIEQRGVVEQVTRSIAPLKDAGNAAAAKAEAEKKAKEAAKALTEAQKELDKSIEATIDSIMDSVEATLKANQSAQDIIAQIEFETEGLKLSNVEREIAIKLRELERAGIEKGTDAYEEYARQIREAVLKRDEVEQSIALAKTQADELQKLNDEIGRGLTDSLFRAFESGKDFFSTLWDGIKNTFKTTVLKMLIQPVQQGMSSFMGGGGGGGGFGGMMNTIGGGLQSLGGMMGEGSTIGGWMNTAGSFLQGGAGSAMGGLSSMMGNFGAGWGVGAQAASGGIGSVWNMGSGMMNAGATQGGLGAMAGGAATLVGGFMAGRALGQAVSGGYGLGGGSGNTAVNIGAAIGAIWGPLGSALGGAIGGVVNRAFGRKAKETTATGVTGSIVGGDFSGQTFTDWKQKGGWFRSDRSGTDLSAVPDELAQIFDQGAAAVYAQTRGYAQALGLPAEAMAAVSHQLRITLGEDEEANTAAIDAAFTAYQAALGATLAAAIEPFRHAGETVVDALARLSLLEAFSASINDLGGIFSKVATSSFEAREAILGMAGGLEAFIGKARSFVDAYYSEAEKAGMQAQQLLEYFSAAGVDSSGLTSREDFRKLVESLDISGEAGQKQLVALLDIAPQFAEVADYLAEQKTTLEALATNAPTVAALQTLGERIGAQQGTLEQQADTDLLTLEAINLGFGSLEEAFNSGLAQLNGSIGRLNNFFAAWDNGDSLNVNTVTP